MSADEETELKDLLVQILEENGTLAKIRAQLRASVFLALEEEERVKSKAPLKNERAKHFTDSQDGRLCAEMVADFLESLNLDSTLSVFMAELDLRQRRPRSSLASAFGISTGSSSAPLLSTILKRNQRQENGKDEDHISPTTKHQPTGVENSKGAEEKFINGSKYFGSHKQLDDEVGKSEDDIFGSGGMDNARSSSILEKSLPATVTVREKNSIGRLNGEENTNQQSQSKSMDQSPRTKSSLEPKDNQDSPKTNSSQAHLADLPDLMGKNRSPFPSVTNEGRSNRLDFMKLLSDSLDDTDKESSPGSSARKVPMLDLKRLDEPKAKGSETGDLKQSKNGNSTREESSEKGRKESMAEDEISEEIAEDLEVDDLDSTRSSRQFSF